MACSRAAPDSGWMGRAPHVPHCKQVIGLCASLAVTLSMQNSAVASVGAVIPGESCSPEAGYIRHSQVGTQPKLASVPVYEVADVEEPSECPKFTGLRKYICYGPCCGLDWGPGGPICLALSAIAFRYSLPFTWISWIRSTSPELDRGVDSAALAFSAALFVSAAPRTVEGFAYSFLFVVTCLM